MRTMEAHGIVVAHAPPADGEVANVDACPVTGHKNANRKGSPLSS
ncbi:hypothetical protein [Micromonospora sp. NPDC000668]